jgi:hypothetical protein
MSDTNTQTLCALQEEGYIESNPEAFKKLIAPTTFFLRQLRPQCGQLRQSLQPPKP